MLAVSVCWLAAEVPGSEAASAPCYRRSENVGIMAIVESKLKLGKVQRQIFLADIVIDAHDPALQKRPEIFHVIGMDDAANVFALTVIHGFVRQARPTIKIAIARVLIGRDRVTFG